MKKTVNILVMEPKPLLMDLTKKAIQAKPDDNYDLHIVGNAITAKAGYFELYKHRPHILFLNPELKDEEGESFIRHALERMPYLKIIVMTARFQDEESYLQAGVSAVAHVPIQRGQLWRKIDQLIEEIDSIGLLDVSEYIPDDDTLSVPADNLFEFEDPSESRDYNPIFEDMRKANETDSLEEQEEHEEFDNHGESNELEFTSEESVETAPLPLIEIEAEAIEPSNEDSSTTEGFVILDNDDFVEHPIEVSKPDSFEESGFLVIEDDEPDELGWDKPKEDLDVVDDDDEETPELAIFDPFAAKEDKSPSKEEDTLHGDRNEESELFTFNPLPTVEDESEESTSSEESDNDSLAIFKFDTEEPEDMDSTEPVEESENTTDDKPSLPLLDLEPHNNEEVESNQTEEQASSEDLFQFETESSPAIPEEKSPILEVVEEQPQEGSPEELPLQEDALPLIQLDKDPEAEDDSEDEYTRTSLPEISTQEYEEDSNEARTKNSLYSVGREYNKSTLKERHTFDSGFYTRNGDFVPMYPPREQFVRNQFANFHRAGVEQQPNVPFNHPQENEPKTESEESLFSSVKKLFRRR